MSRVERQMEDLFERLVRDVWSPLTSGTSGAGPALEVVDRKDEIVLRADLPGVDPNEVQVEVQDNNTLVLRGERKEQQEEQSDTDYYYSERWSGSFVRMVQLPSSIDADKIAATCKNGVLEVHLPKKQESQGRKIEIQSSSP